MAADGSVYISLTNNTTVNDSHGSVRRLRERGNDPEASASPGGLRRRRPDRRRAGSEGFSSPDNLVFDGAGNLWVVTDISSSRLNDDNEYAYHENNAMFMVPTTGPNAGVAFRFANVPVHCRADRALLHARRPDAVRERPAPGRADRQPRRPVFGEPTYTSWWPEGDRTANHHPTTPRPSVVAVTRDH